MSHVPLPAGITIRAYRDEDAPSTLDVFLRAVRVTASADYDAADIVAWAPDDIDIAGWHKRRSTATTWVAVRENEVVGFTDLLTTDSTDTGHIDMMFVDPDVGRRGIATALIATAFTEAERRGYAILTLEGSITARPFFERHGFAVVTEQTVERDGQLITNFVMRRTTGRI